jgi:hypothetical protein
MKVRTSETHLVVGWYRGVIPEQPRLGVRRMLDAGRAESSESLATATAYAISELKASQMRDDNNVLSSVV